MHATCRMHVADEVGLSAIEFNAAQTPLQTWTLSRPTWPSLGGRNRATTSRMRPLPLRPAARSAGRRISPARLASALLDSPYGETHSYRCIAARLERAPRWERPTWRILFRLWSPATA